jgi:hypothetical protein
VPRRTDARSAPTAIVQLAGAITCGVAIDTTCAGERVLLPAGTMDPGDLVYRMAAALPELDIERGDLLVVEPRASGRAATAELVLAQVGPRPFIGRWWAKAGVRTLLAGDLHTITDDPALRVLGTITLIVRPQG